MDCKVRLSIRAPKKNGGKPILSYQYTMDEGLTWANASLFQLNGNTFFYVNDLINGTRYVFRIRALNEIGPGAVSKARAARPRRVPSAPAILSITPYRQRLDASIVAPADTGGLLIKRYQASINGSTWTPTTISSLIDTIEVHGLRGKRVYSLKLRACNGAGCGPASNEMSATTK